MGINPEIFNLFGKTANEIEEMAGKYGGCFWFTGNCRCFKVLILRRKKAVAVNGLFLDA